MTTSDSQRIDFHTGCRKEQFISSRFDLRTPCLNTSGSNGNRIARRGCDLIRHHGMPKPNASITSVSLVLLSVGLMPVTARVFYDARIAPQLWLKRCVSLTASELLRLRGL